MKLDYYYFNQNIMKKIIFIFALTLFLSGCTFGSGLRFIPKTDSKEVGQPDFQYKPSLDCEIKISSNAEEVAKKITFSDLDTVTPKIYYQADRPIAADKIYENNGRLVLQTVAGGNVSVETILINKETGVFSKSSMGDFWGIYAMIAKGWCVAK
jgi:hypothetical protein